MTQADIDGLAAMLEPISAGGWPPRTLARLGGWRLQASDGFSGRANACWPIGAPDRPLSEAIAAVEAWYRDRGLPTLFRPADIRATAALRAALTERGYRPRAQTLVMIGPLVPGDSPASLSLDPDPGFSAVFLASAPSPGDAAERIETLARIPPPRAFARIDVDGAPAAIGAAALNGAWAGLFGMRTIADHRRQGLARAILAALAGQAAAHGATGAYLQVEAVNAPAITLYRRMGFETVYTYHYWSLDQGSTKP